MSSFFVLRVLLLAMLVMVTVLKVAQCQCEDYKSAETTICSMLFQRFQSALVNSELNLYNLKKTFSPASHPAPILVNVSYEISFGHIPNELCPGVDNDSMLFNTSETQYLNYGWTSSVLYSYYHPAELNRAQPQLVFLFLKSLEYDPEDDTKHFTTAFTWDGTGPITTAQLSLYIPSLRCSPSYKEVNNILRDITSLLKVYTETQTNLTTWNTKGAGYVMNGSAFSYPHYFDYAGGSFGLMYIYSVLLSTFLAILAGFVITCMICTYTPKNSESVAFKVRHSLFWTSFGIVAQCTAVFVIVDIAKAGSWCHSSAGCSAAGILKIVWFSFSSGISLFAVLYSSFQMCVTNTLSSNTPLLNVEGKKLALLFPPLISFPCFVLGHIPGASSVSTAVFNIILFPTLFTFFSVTFLYSIPVLLLLVVYPVKVAAAYSFLIAALVLCILIIFYVESTLSFLKDSESYYVLSCLYLCLPMLNMMLIGALLILFYSVYGVLSYGYAENSVFHAIVSFLPSLILSSLVWFFKTRISKWLVEKAKDETPEQATSDVNTASQMNEQQEHSDDATSDIDTQQEHSEQEHLLHQQSLTQNGTTNEMEDAV